jgi:hypothetical protein
VVSKRASQPPLSAKPAEQLGEEKDQQDCPQPYANPAAGTPAAMAVVSSAATKNQQQNNDEY